MAASINYDEAVRYLVSLGRELASPQQARATKFGLENIRALTEHLGHPERRYPSAHIAGTNGKGSTAAMLASILESAGMRTGLYTSPHLARINERIRVAGREISDDDFAAAVARIRRAIEELLASGALAAHPTFFECVTAIAFDEFARAGVEFAVFEVGMGGRLDATNVIEPEVAVITQIAFDHETFLGHSIEEIAGEKAGIIKPGAWVVSAAENPAARAVIRARAEAQNARLIEIDEAFHVKQLGASDFTGDFHDLRHATRFAAIEKSSGLTVELVVPLAGRFQQRNAVTAVAAARLLAARRASTVKGFVGAQLASARSSAIDDTAIVRGIAQVRWPGRLERIGDRPAVYLDGAHNPAGARELLAFWDEHFAGVPIHLVYGALRDKPVDEICGLLFPRAASVIITEPRQPRALSASVLAAMTGHLANTFEIVPDPAAALERAVLRAAPEDAVFATGSLYLIEDYRRGWANIYTAGASSPALRQPPR
ncbi:MAG: folylpolyglutamate synthase/dihydrofolate synthase family protein [Candidatus Acidiferrales bacterium]